LGKTAKGKPAAPSSNTAKIINVLLIVGALLITSGIVWYSMKGPSKNAAARPVLPKPDVTTLDPEQFSGKARLAYAAAREVPEVLVHLPCYCGCMSGFGHRNNLDCFHDEHGVECTMCQDIALDARDMYKNGYDIDRIRQAIKDKYGRYAALSNQ
jgi:Protein of unknown function with PCYCGC motif